MKKSVLVILPALMTATPAFAQAALVDADGNGTYSHTELTAAYPEVSEDDFAQIDANGDGEIDEDELAMAKDAGILGSEG
ncbi:hypothetical protein M8756_09955 [Lutimaribacter sp. EGI FJ00015]|nr:hypothetical protein [Lutimaribacter sp. EGI FJ00015]MCO0636601.1 hypothetical protein [Lutimaribacter sp. EGI FJ00014]